MRKRQWLSKLERQVLTAISLLADEANTISIEQHILETRGKPVHPARIHIAVDRLVEEGCIRCWLSEPLPKLNGRRRRECQLQTIGKRALQEPDWSPEPPVVDTWAHDQGLYVVVVMEMWALNARIFHIPIPTSIITIVCAAFAVKSYVRMKYGSPPKP